MWIMTPEIRNGSRAFRRGMKTITLMLCAALSLACAVKPAQEAPGGEVKVQTLAAGGTALDAPTAQTVAAFDETSFRDTWARKVGTGEPPRVDFSKNAAVFLFAGVRNTGGYSVVVRGASVEGESLVVDAVVEGPKPGAIVSQAITYPYAVIAVTPREFRSVRWHETAKAPAR